MCICRTHIVCVLLWPVEWQRSLDSSVTGFCSTRLSQLLWDQAWIRHWRQLLLPEEFCQVCAALTSNQCQHCCWPTLRPVPQCSILTLLILTSKTWSFKPPQKGCVLTWGICFWPAGHCRLVQVYWAIFLSIFPSLSPTVTVLRCFIGMTNTFTFILPKHCCVQLKVNVKLKKLEWNSLSFSLSPSHTQTHTFVCWYVNSRGCFHHFVKGLWIIVCIWIKVSVKTWCSNGGCWKVCCMFFHITVQMLDKCFWKRAKV